MESKDENDTATENRTTTDSKPAGNLNAFEENLINIFRNVEVRKSRTSFQTDLMNVVRNIGKCRDVQPFYELHCKHKYLTDPNCKQGLLIGHLH